VWYCPSVRHLIAAVVVAVTAACGGGQIQNLQLRWQSADMKVSPSPTVAQAFAAVPITFGIRDTRPDPTVVGKYEDDGFVVRTTDNVAQYCSNRFGDMLRTAGARLTEAPQAILAADLVEYRVDEGSTFAGVVRLRMTVRRAGQPDWSKDYEGTSKRWGKSHNPDNFNEALSNALAEATTNILHDEEFGHALMFGGPAAPVPGEPSMAPGEQPTAGR
jgi:hypothetical protein